MVVKRKKKWLGAVIGGVASIGSSLINARNQANMQEEALNEQQRAQTQQLAMQNAANLTSRYADTSYADAMQDKISFKAGGKTKDRVAVAKRFACGGRKRKSMGGTKNNDDPYTNKVSENYINRFPYVTRMLSEPPMSSYEKKFNKCWT